MSILIADSGGTKTAWALASDDGCATYYTTQGINPFHQDRDEIARILTAELQPQLGDSRVGSVFFYGSGCREEQRPMMERVLRRCFPQATTVDVNGDLLGAAHAVCGQDEGIAAILGTGANSCLYDGETIVANTPPLGYILGDEGSGAVLGRLFINALYKGLLPARLKDVFEQTVGMSMSDVIARVYQQPLANRFLASLSPFIHDHIGVEAVREIVVTNFRDFFRRNVTAYHRADLPVGFVGSVANAYKDELRAAAEAEGFAVGVVTDSPLQALLRFHCH